MGAGLDYHEVRRTKGGGGESCVVLCGAVWRDTDSLSLPVSQLEMVSPKYGAVYYYIVGFVIIVRNHIRDTPTSVTL